MTDLQRPGHDVIWVDTAALAQLNNAVTTYFGAGQQAQRGRVGRVLLGKPNPRRAQNRAALELESSARAVVGSQRETFIAGVHDREQYTPVPRTAVVELEAQFGAPGSESTITQRGRSLRLANGQVLLGNGISKGIVRLTGASFTLLLAGYGLGAAGIPVVETVAQDIFLWSLLGSAGAKPIRDFGNKIALQGSERGKAIIDSGANTGQLAISARGLVGGPALTPTAEVVAPAAGQTHELEPGAPLPGTPPVAAEPTEPVVWPLYGNSTGQTELPPLIPTLHIGHQTVAALRERLTAEHGGAYSQIRTIHGRRNEIAEVMRNEVILDEATRPLSLLLAYTSTSINFRKGVGGTPASLAGRATRRAATFDRALQLLGVSELVAEHTPASVFRDHFLADEEAPVNLDVLRALGMEVFLRSFETTPIGVKERTAVRNRTGTTIVQEPLLDVMNAGRRGVGWQDDWTMKSPEFLELLPEPLRPRVAAADTVGSGASDAPDFEVNTASLGS